MLCAVTELNSVDVSTSTEFYLVMAQSTAHEPPEDGRKYGPKHVGVSF